jgi:hypothetical protein
MVQGRIYIIATLVANKTTKKKKWEKDTRRLEVLIPSICAGETSQIIWGNNPINRPYISYPQEMMLGLHKRSSV